MIKTKIFEEGYDNPDIDKQINKWIDQHPDYIIVDIKLQKKKRDAKNREIPNIPIYKI